MTTEVQMMMFTTISARDVKVGGTIVEEMRGAC